MSQDLNQDEILRLAELLVKSQKVEARKALCIKIGIEPHKLPFLSDKTEESFAINLITYLNQVGNTTAICQLCCQELRPIFQGGEHEFLKEIAAKVNCNPECISDILKPPKTFSSIKYKLLTGAVVFLTGLSGFYLYAQNIPYQQLESSLKNQDWKSADDKTSEILGREAGINDIAQRGRGDIKLNEKQIQKISCPVLQKLNNLWEINSKERFGFRKQNSIWKSVNQENWNEFAYSVGWTKNNKTWESSLTFTTTAKEGHLPSFIFVPDGNISWNEFFKRVEECKL